MTRITGVSADRAGPFVKLAYFFTRRRFARLTGRETKRMNERLIERSGWCLISNACSSASDGRRIWRMLGVSCILCDDRCHSERIYLWE